MVKQLITSAVRRLMLLSGGGPAQLDVSDTNEVFAKIPLAKGALHLFPYAPTLTTVCPDDSASAVILFAFINSKGKSGAGDSSTFYAINEADEDENAVA